MERNHRQKCIKGRENFQIQSNVLDILSDSVIGAKEPLVREGELKKSNTRTPGSGGKSFPAKGIGVQGASKIPHGKKTGAFATELA